MTNNLREKCKSDRILSLCMNNNCNIIISTKDDVLRPTNSVFQLTFPLDYGKSFVEARVSRRKCSGFI